MRLFFVLATLFIGLQPALAFDPPKVVHDRGSAFKNIFELSFEFDRKTKCLDVVGQELLDFVEAKHEQNALDFQLDAGSDRPIERYRICEDETNKKLRKFLEIMRARDLIPDTHIRQSNLRGILSSLSSKFAGTLDRPIKRRGSTFYFKAYYVDEKRLQPTPQKPHNYVLVRSIYAERTAQDYWRAMEKYWKLMELVSEQGIDLNVQKD